MKGTEIVAVRSKRRSSIIVRVVLLLFSVWMIYYLGTLIKSYSTYQNELSEKTAIKNELALEIQEKTTLLENGNDKVFIEKAAREKLGYVYPNEHEFIDVVK